MATEQYQNMKVPGAMSVHLHNSISAHAMFQINLNRIPKQEALYVLNWRPYGITIQYSTYYVSRFI
jgi:hypothetical protein